MNKKAIGSTLNFDIDQIANVIDQIVNGNKNCPLTQIALGA